MPNTILQYALRAHIKVVHIANIIGGRPFFLLLLWQAIHIKRQYMIGHIHRWFTNERVDMTVLIISLELT